MWLIIKALAFYNKRKIMAFKQDLDLLAQTQNDDVIENKISARVIEDLYQALEKHFGIKASLLRPSDRLKLFYDTDSFNLNENCEEFEKELKSKYDIEIDKTDIASDLLALMIKMQKRSETQETIRRN
jgi:hypothetical protein